MVHNLLSAAEKSQSACGFIVPKQIRPPELKFGDCFHGRHTDFEVNEINIQ